MKWIEMMVKKLTARYMSLNRQFKVQRHTIVCQSGMEDYVSVTIDHTESFSFDFFIYPEDGHNMMGRDRVHLHQHITRYFMDFLK